MYIPDAFEKKKKINKEDDVYRPKFLPKGAPENENIGVYRDSRQTQQHATNLFEPHLTAAECIGDINVRHINSKIKINERRGQSRNVCDGGNYGRTEFVSLAQLLLAFFFSSLAVHIFV